MSFVFNNAKGAFADAANLSGGAVLRAALVINAVLSEAIEKDADFMDDLSAAFVEPTDPSYARVALTGVDFVKDDTNDRADLVANKAVFSALAGAEDVFGAVAYLDPDGTDTESQNVPLVFQRNLSPVTTDGQDYEQRWNAIDGVGTILRGV